MARRHHPDDSRPPSRRAARRPAHHSSVAAFLQRLGRSGRRSETTRNALLLTTSDPALLRAASILLRWSEGYVEPIIPPPDPLHLAAQQLLALALQDSGTGRYTWVRRLGYPFILGPRVEALVPEIVDHLLSEGYLDDQGGILGIGNEAESAFGRKHLLELLSVFTSPPVLSVRHDRNEIGLVPDEALLARPPGAAAGGAAVLALGGRSWLVLHVDRLPDRSGGTDERPRRGAMDRWRSAPGSPRRPRHPLRPRRRGPRWRGGERQGTGALGPRRADHGWARPETTTIVRSPTGRTQW